MADQREKKTVASDTDQSSLSDMGMKPVPVSPLNVHLLAQTVGSPVVI